ncbi:MAG: hypothetical protein OEU76_08835, partial [Cyclobacteriaceae bacterium]|nr:hypothetical protein [Cyclobacteriaceae bacterium]
AVNILLVGNNPIELSSMLDTIKKIPGGNVMTEIAFDLTSIGQRLLNFRPNFILIDDNIGVTILTQTVERLSSNPKTRDIPITVLKNSNYSGSVVSNDIMDYVLKRNLTSEALLKSLGNSLKFKRTRQLVMIAIKKRPNRLLGLMF